MQVHVPYHTYANEDQEYVDSHVVHTSQLFFSDTLYEEIALLEPYSQSTTYRVRNTEDHVYQADPTAELSIMQTESHLLDGTVGTITAIVDPAATPSLAQSQTMPDDFDQNWESEAANDPVVNAFSPSPTATPAVTADAEPVAASRQRCAVAPSAFCLLFYMCAC